MKFLHVADIHLDSPLSGLQSRADLPGDIVRSCTRRAFEAMITLALEEDIAFMIIAGDLYDGDWKDFSTGLFFAEQMRRFNRPCYVLRGNHDARSVITKNLSKPPKVEEFSSHFCETFTLAEFGVVLHGRSFPNRAVPEDLSVAYPVPVPGMLNIGVLHTSAEDPGEHEVYAPCSVAALALKGYDYWALGHIHARKELHRFSPWIVFPGNLQGRHIRETGPKGCTLVTVEDRVITNVEHRDVDVLRWAMLDVDATQADILTLSKRIELAAQAAVADADGRPVLARLMLTGETSLHGTLLGDTARQRLELLKDAPAIPWDAEARLASAISEQNQAVLDTKRESQAIKLQSAHLAGLARDATLMAAQDAIDQLAEARHAAVQAEADLPSLRLSIEGHRASVAEALRELGLSVTAQDARDAIPDPATRSRVRVLAREHASLAAAVITARSTESVAKLRCEKAATALAATPKPADPAILRATINMVRSEGRLDEDLAEAASLAKAASKKALTALAALPIWSGDLDSLASCPVPLETDTGLAGAAFEITKEATLSAEAAVAKTRQELNAVDGRLRGLTERGTVSTPAAVAAARMERDVTWKLVRQALNGEPTPSAPPVGELTERYEQQLDAADHLADQRADDAHRVAEFLAETAKRETLGELHEADIRAQSEAAVTFEAAKARWIEIWAASGITPTTVAAMAEWRRRRDEVLRLRGEAIEATQRHDVEVERCNAARSALLQMLPDAPSDGTVASLLARAEANCAAAEEVLAAHNALAEGLKREKDAQPELRAACGQAEAALAEWRVKWAPAITQLGLPEATGVEEAEAALAAWSRIAEAAPAWRQDASRVTELEKTAAAFRASVELALTAAGAPPLTEPATVVAMRLIRQLVEARKAETEAEALSKRIQEHDDALKIAQQNSEAAKEKLAELRRIARVEDDSSLEEEIKRARSRDTTEADIKSLERDLGAQGDGHDEAALRAAALAADVDAAAARLVEIEERITALGVQREVLSESRARKLAELQMMGRGQNAAGALQEQQQHLAEAGAAAGRYAQLHVARTLLYAGIERFRRRQQGPLLTAASKHFADLTRGRYSRLGTDLDTAGKPVLLAIQRDGTECPIDGLSEGARDQLFLALRVAAIEAHVSSSEPLPFVADDLLVHFDDGRARAAIDLLIELGRTTQVILFTHHDHVASIAEGCGSHVSVVRWNHSHQSGATPVPASMPAVA